MGDYTHAIAIREAELKKLERELGLEHPKTLDTVFNLGVAYLEDDRPEEALPHLQVRVRGAVR